MKNGMKSVLLLLLVGFVFGQNQVDTVSQLLAELKGTAQVELTNCNADYSVAKTLKENIIFNLGKALQEQNFLCALRDQKVAERTSDIEKTSNYIIYLNKRLDDNARRIKTLEDNRCTHNSNYIERVKNDNLTLRLIIFLRTSLENLDQAQLGRYGMYVQKFLQIYKNAKVQELVELANEFRDTMYIDWQAEPIPQGRDFKAYRQELIDMLNDMERFIRAQIKKTQDLEIATGVSLGDFKGAIDIENEQLRFDVALEEKNVIKLNDKLVQDKLAADECRARAKELAASQSMAQDDLTRMAETYNRNKARLQEELNLFEDVYRIYSTQVNTSDDQFKQRVDQYVKQEEMTDYGRSDYSLSDAVRKQVTNE